MVVWLHRVTKQRGNNLKNVLASIAVAGLTLAPVATLAAPGQSDNVTFCHATASVGNPYVTITTDPDSIIRAGHDTHNLDIIPPFKYTERNGKDEVEKNYGGNNWNAAGQAILANNCAELVPVPTPTPTASASPTATGTKESSPTTSPTASVSQTASPTGSSSGKPSVSPSGSPATGSATPTAGGSPTQSGEPTTPTPILTINPTEPAPIESIPVTPAPGSPEEPSLAPLPPDYVPPVDTPAAGADVKPTGFKELPLTGTQISGIVLVALILMNVGFLLWAGSGLRSQK